MAFHRHVAAFLATAVPLVLLALGGPAGAEETREILVKFRPGAAANQAIGQLERDVPVSGRRVIGPLGVRVLDVPAAASQQAVDRLVATGAVEYAEPAFPMEALQLQPDDPLWPWQWGPRRVSAPAAWERTTGSSGLVVAVLDTGVSAHPDLSGRVLPGRNFVSGEDPADLADRAGHGTAVAGVVAARGDNGVGMAGMCWECGILPVKVLGDDGRGSTAMIAEGITWAANQGADVINLSLGGPTGGQAMGDAVAYAVERGAVVVGAAGNAGVDEQVYPAAYPSVIAVAGSREDDTRYAWSNFGSWVDIAAPGCNVVTTETGDYGSGCGTSFAAPVVSGVAALAMSADPDATPLDVRTAVEATATPVGYVRHGRVRADAALDALLPDAEPVPAPDPEPEPEPESEPLPETEPEPLPDVEPARACPPGEVPPSGLTDLGDGVHGPSVECVVWYGIARGFPDQTYRPGQSVERGQLATFLVGQLRAAGVELQEPVEAGFLDIAGSVHETSINQLADLGVVEGKTATRYEPQSPVTRAQMASFLWRSHRVITGDGLPVVERHFDDTAGSVHRDTIDALASAAIVDGRGERTYAPNEAVRRGPMASFLAKHLEALAEQGHVTHP